MSHPVLNPLQSRILGVLVEKQLTVPDTYPLSLNALRSGCNQQNNRDPVMNVSEPELATELDALRGLSLVIESSGSRTLRYEQNIKRVLEIAGAAVPLLAVLMLRGPQTAAELRLNTERMQRFADASSVEAFLQELAGHSAGALVIELDRRPGERERRWMHRLVPDDRRLTEAPSQSEVTTSAPPGIARLAPPAARFETVADGVAERLQAIEARLEALERRINGV